MYRISIDKKAYKELAHLPKKDYAKIVDSIYKLAENPKPYGYKELKGYPDHFRIRQGNYRIIYNIVRKALIINVIKIGHRKDVYEAF
ncbi:MAG TPA: type II toxin-antitoxin system RelE/ParE family toxin [Bacteroidia bacterium]|jgi:mRNA interferase RelE/StbE|nr:type II toxin-antitoxin system RelE/ParE family toxin [Bacteroidia bacterium]